MLNSFKSRGTRSSRRVRQVLLSLALFSALPTAAVLGSPASASADPTVQAFPAYASRADFYNAATVPSPAPPGTLIRYQPVGTSQFRVMYWTQQPVIQPGGATTIVTVPATALVNKPTAARPANGYPVIAWTHGTAGFNANCATSFFPSTAFYANWMLVPTAWSVAPDYVGLGVDSGVVRSSDKDHLYVYAGFIPDKPFDRTSHPYLSREGTGRTTLDAVRATRKLDTVLAPGANLGGKSRTLVIGISEGGHAALATGEVHTAGYAALDIDLKAVVAGAPPSDIDFNEYEPLIQKTLAPSVVVGRSLEHLDVRPVNLLSDAGKWAYANANEDSCTKDFWSPLPGVVAGYPLKDGINYGDLTDSVKQPAMARSLAAVRIGTRKIAAPVLVSQVEGDPIVLPQATARMIARLRTWGTTVSYCTYAGTTGDVLARTANHATSIDKVRAGTGGTCSGLPSGTPTTSPTMTQWLTTVGANFTS